MVLMLGLDVGLVDGHASHATPRVDAFRDARAALQMIERDLRNLVRDSVEPGSFHQPGTSALCSFGISTTRVTLPAAYFALKNIYAGSCNRPESQSAAVCPGRLRKTAGSSGDVCAVGYYCRWDTQLHAYTSPAFFSGQRRHVYCDAGRREAMRQTPFYTLPGASDPVLAAYVWNFKITLYDAAGTVITHLSMHLRSIGYNSHIMLPAAIEISFNAMSPQAAQAVISVTSRSELIG